MATFIIVGIVLVPIILLLADLLVGKHRMTSSTRAAHPRRPRR